MEDLADGRGVTTTIEVVVRVEDGTGCARESGEAFQDDPVGDVTGGREVLFTKPDKT